MVNQVETAVLIDQLSEVIEERKIGYLKASSRITDPYLKVLFASHSNFCDILKKDLPSSSHDHFISHRNESSYKWKYWFELKPALKSGCRLDILEACIKGEQRTIDLLHELLADTQVSPLIKLSLSNPLRELKKACDLLKIFKISL